MEGKAPKIGSPVRAGAVAGLLAGLMMGSVMLVLRAALGTPSIPELITDQATYLIPPGVFGFLIDTLLSRGKPLMFLGLFLLQVGVGALVGAGYALGLERLAWLPKPRVAAGAALGGALWLAHGLAFGPLVGAGLLGASARGGQAAFLGAAAAYYLAYGLSLAYLLDGRRGEDAEAQALQSSRRAFLRKAALWTAGVAVLGYGARLVVQTASSTPSRSYSQPGVLSSMVTPTDRFYIVSKNIVDPEVSAGAWVLRMDGLVDRPSLFTLEDLKALPGVEEYVTLTCISNPVGGQYISNALWKGVPLRDILERAGVKPGVRKVAFHAADGYSDSITLEQAKKPEVLIAYQMNGQPLTREHGFPARLLVPGLYGLKSVKWLTRIEPVAEDFQGYWQVRGWSDTAVVKTMARFDVPVDGAQLPLAPAALGGVAFAGLRGVQRVEISADGGVSWQPAVLEGPLSPYTWVIWTASWQPPGYGPLTLMVRAVDGTGEVQAAQVRGSIPDGASGYHKIRVTVG